MIYVCARNDFSADWSAVESAISPDNITPRKSRGFTAKGIKGSIVNPSGDELVSDGGALVGLLFPQTKDWDRIGAAAPDGNYLLARWDARSVEVLTDATASRTGWYVLTDDLFVLSNSMRAIVALLGSFEPNPEAVSWVLGTGCLGPDQAWDRRIRMLPADSTLRLDRKAWSLTVETKAAVFTDTGGDLENAIKDTLSGIELADHRALSLSGGVDSRGLLLMMPEPRPRCFSIKARTEPASARDDVTIARQVAKAANTTHDVVEFDDVGTELRQAMNRFFRLAESRVDHFSAAAGGWGQWKALFETGTSSILRGDEGFGWSHALNEEQVLAEIGVAGLHRYFTPEQIERFELTPYTLPAELERGPDEPLEDWRDRLYHRHRLPVILSALTEAKAGFVDVVNPFLSRRILETVRSLPPEDRTEKAAFRKIVLKLLPSIPFAAKGSMRSLAMITGDRDFKQIASDVLNGPVASEMFSFELRSNVLGRLNAVEAKRSNLGAIAKRLFPASIVTRLRAAKHSGIRPIHPGVLAFRMVMIAETVRLMREDAKLL